MSVPHADLTCIPDGRAFHVYGRHPDGRQFHVYGTLDGTLAVDPSAAAASLARRFDRLTGAWVLISPARNTRPGGTVGGEHRSVCPLCPGGAELPWPFEVAVFDNRFPSIAVDIRSPTMALVGQLGRTMPGRRATRPITSCRS